MLELAIEVLEHVTNDDCCQSWWSANGVIINIEGRGREREKDEIPLANTNELVELSYSHRLVRLVGQMLSLSLKHNSTHVNPPNTSRIRSGITRI